MNKVVTAFGLLVICLWVFAPPNILLVKKDLQEVIDAHHELAGVQTSEPLGLERRNRFFGDKKSAPKGALAHYPGLDENMSFTIFKDRIETQETSASDEIILFEDVSSVYREDPSTPYIIVEYNVEDREPYALQLVVGNASGTSSINRQRRREVVRLVRLMKRLQHEHQRQDVGADDDDDDDNEYRWENEDDDDSLGDEDEA